MLRAPDEVTNAKAGRGHRDSYSGPMDLWGPMAYVL